MREKNRDEKDREGCERRRKRSLNINYYIFFVKFLQEMRKRSKRRRRNKVIEGSQDGKEEGRA